MTASLLRPRVKPTTNPKPILASQTINVARKKSRRGLILFRANAAPQKKRATLKNSKIIISIMR